MEKHTTVLLTEAVDALAIKADGVYVDATLGAYGHGGRIVAALGPRGTYLGIDADPTAVEAAERDLRGTCHIVLKEGNFSTINSIVESSGYDAVDGILADLGWRMEQFSGNGKGFSFQIDEPLVMTYGDPQHYPFTALDIAMEWDEENIVTILQGYGEERYARRIARGIIGAREAGSIATTFDLVRVIESSVPRAYLHGKIHPATRTFQALRMAVNDELGVLERFLEHARGLLKPGGRLAVITFHSLEDRLVKHTLRSFEHDQSGVVLTKKPIIPTREEINQNKRSRSAKLRIFQKS